MPDSTEVMSKAASNLSTLRISELNVLVCVQSEGSPLAKSPDYVEKYGITG